MRRVESEAWKDKKVRITDRGMIIDMGSDSSLKIQDEIHQLGCH